MTESNSLINVPLHSTFTVQFAPVRTSHPVFLLIDLRYYLHFTCIIYSLSSTSGISFRLNARLSRERSSTSPFAVSTQYYRTAWDTPYTNGPECNIEWPIIRPIARNAPVHLKAWSCIGILWLSSPSKNTKGFPYFSMPSSTILMAQRRNSRTGPLPKPSSPSPEVWQSV